MTFYDFGETIDNNTKFVFFGIPWDYLSSLKTANSSMAPQKIREISENLSLTTELGIGIPKLRIVDVGDVPIEPSNTENNIMEITNELLLSTRRVWPYNRRLETRKESPLH